MGDTGRAPPFPSIQPQLATPAEGAPAGVEWVHEIKYDGYRLIAEVRDGGARLLTRHRQDWTDRFPTVAAALRGLALESAVLDGEVVVVRSDGRSSFQDLQNVLSGGRGVLRYCLFDLPYRDGRDLRAAPLLERKAELNALLERSDGEGALFFTDHVEGRGPEFLRQACAHGLEGIISKRSASPYREGRSRDWLKVKCSRREEFVVVGFTEPSSRRHGIGALLLATRSRGKGLVFAGRVGSGFTERFVAELRPVLEALELPRCPLEGLVPADAGAAFHWVQPCLVAEVAYAGWTADGLLRHPSFKGLRQDVPASAVTRDAADAPGGAGSG